MIQVNRRKWDGHVDGYGELIGPEDSPFEEVTVEMVVMTPKMATKILNTQNTRNRRIKRPRVDLLVSALQRGEYRLNPNGIGFDRSGVLIDGQHRLLAIAQSEVSIPMFVIRGLPAGSQDVVDVGSRRNLSDQLMIHGETRTHSLASVLMLVWRWHEGSWETPATVRPTIPQALQFLGRNPEVREAMIRADRVVDRLPFRTPVSILGAAMFRAEQLDPDGCADFFERQFAAGVNLGETDPAYQLRERLAHLGAASRRTKARVKAEYPLALIVKAWNAYQLGNPVGQLRWTLGGSKPEAFPTMLGPDDLS